MNVVDELNEIKSDILESYTTRVAEISLLQNGVIKCQVNDNVCLTDDDIIELIDLFDDMTSGVCRPILIVTGENNSLSRDAMELNLSSLKGPKGSARAIVVNDDITKVAVNIYFRLHPPALHTMFFSKEENAIEWLTSNFVNSGARA